MRVKGQAISNHDVGTVSLAIVTESGTVLTSMEIDMNKLKNTTVYHVSLDNVITALFSDVILDDCNNAYPSVTYCTNDDFIEI